MWTSSALSISSSMPVILPARSGNMRWMRGNSLSPSICFCSCGGAAASIVAVKASWSDHLPWHHLGWGVASSWSVLEALLRPHLLGANHWHWWHAWPGHHGHWLRTRLVHRPRLLLPNSGSSNPWSTRSNSASHAHSSHAHARHPAGPWHRLLLRPAGLGADLGRSEESLGLRHRGHKVASHAHLLHAAHLLHPHPSHPLDVLGGKVGLPV